jgi:hypothetical protein
MSVKMHELISSSFHKNFEGEGKGKGEQKLVKFYHMHIWKALNIITFLFHLQVRRQSSLN